MRKWEYKTVDKARLNERELNQLGDEGWELVLYSYDKGQYLFKRPKS
jgi:hypothetical protein